MHVRTCFSRKALCHRSLLSCCWWPCPYTGTYICLFLLFLPLFPFEKKGFICASWCDSDSNSDVAVSCESVGGGWEYEERNALYWIHVLVIHLPLSASKLLLSSLLVIFHRLSVPFLSSPVHTLVWRALYLVFVFVKVENNLLLSDLIWLTHH